MEFVPSRKAALLGRRSQRVSGVVSERSGVRQRLLRRARKDLQPRLESGSGVAHAVDGNADGGALHSKASAPPLTSNRDTLLQSSAPNQGWQQAWIEIMDTIGPLFPGVPEV